MTDVQQQTVDDAPTPDTRPAVRRPDASMTLLSDLIDNALDSGYARVADRPASSAAGSGRARRAVILLLVFALAGLVLAEAANEARAGAPSAARVRDGLVERVQERTEGTDALQQRVVAARSEVDRLGDRLLGFTSADQDVSAQLKSLATTAGTVPVRGPGIQVDADDASKTDAGPEQGLGRILDVDLQRLVNGLWAAGAEAVSVNGQRLTALTAIRSAGDAILVAYRPLSPPYKVLAIGDPENLEVDFVDGPGGRWFRSLANFGISFEVTRQNSLSLPAASDATLRLADARQASDRAGAAGDDVDTADADGGAGS